MAEVLIRDLKPETHRALKLRAKQHGRSVSAEIRAVLEEAVQPPERLKLGTWLHERAMEFGGLDLEIERDPTPTDPAIFE
jgi:plasmid stability protein